MFLFGERAGQKIAPNGNPLPPPGTGFDHQGGIQQQIAALSGHNSSLLAMERRAGAAGQTALVRKALCLIFIHSQTYHDIF